MTKKLTLTIEESVIERGKKYAKGTQRSLSEMVQKYLESLGNDEKNNDFLPIVQRLAGSLPLPKNFDEKGALEDYYKEKYGF